MAEKLELGNSYTTDISSYSLADVDILLFVIVLLNLTTFSR